MTPGHERITATIVEQLEAGLADPQNWSPPWVKMGSTGWPSNEVTKHRYRGGNVLNLSVMQWAKGFTTSHWATYQQWQDVGAQVKKGEKSSLIFFYGTARRGNESETDGESPGPGMGTRYVRFGRCYSVFNRDQVDNPPPLPEPPPLPNLAQRHDAAVAPIAKLVEEGGLLIEHVGDRACYIPSLDKVMMPSMAAFKGADIEEATANYYATLYHEVTHWTGAPQRLDRDKSRIGKSDMKRYAFEELVAELASAFAMAEIGFETRPRQDHLDYLSSWIAGLKAEPKILWNVGSQAAKAVDWIFGRVPAELQEPLQEAA